MTRDELVGFVLLTKAPSAPRLNYEDRDLLKTVGNHVAVHLAQEKSDSLLAEAQQFEAYNRLTAFLMHDLNNLIAQQSLIVKNAEKHKRNPDFVDDAIETIKGSVDRMTRVMSQLKRENTELSVKDVELLPVLRAAIDRCNDREPNAVLESALNGFRAVLDPDQLSMIIVHLVRNAQDATSQDGQIKVNAVHEADVVTLEIADSGVGMSEDFIRERLFRPFDSTKGAQGMGIGVYQAREFARNNGGDLVAYSRPGEGTRMVLTLRARRG
jgi:putative PEP-CTERM system histidine kinase